MINTNKIGSYPKDDKAEEVFQQYIKLESEDRSKFMSKVTNWLTKRIEEDNKRRAELEVKK